MFCNVYIDNILVFSGLVDEHIALLCQVFKRMQELALNLHLQHKCNLGHSKVFYLGHVVSQEGISLDPEKLRAIDCFPVHIPVKKSLHEFVGHAKYYCRFVLGISKTVFTAMVKCLVLFERGM